MRVVSALLVFWERSEHFRKGQNCRSDQRPVSGIQVHYQISSSFPQACAERFSHCANRESDAHET